MKIKVAFLVCMSLTGVALVIMMRPATAIGAGGYAAQTVISALFVTLLMTGWALALIFAYLAEVAKFYLTMVVMGLTALLLTWLLCLIKPGIAWFGYRSDTESLVWSILIIWGAGLMAICPPALAFKKAACYIRRRLAPLACL